jgi:hypothetical protein
MADTKQQAKSKRTQSKRSSTGSGSKSSKASKAKAKNGKAPSSATAKNGAGGKAQNGNGAQSTSNGTAPIMQKAKVPLLAGGAAVAGVAGAVLAASRSGGKRKVMGVSVPKRSKLSLPKGNGFKSDARKVTSAVAGAAKRADRFGQGVSRIASSVQQVSESADEAVKKS